MVLRAADGDDELGHAVPERESPPACTARRSRRHPPLTASLRIPRLWQTTTTERDFDVLAPPSLIDDAGELIHDPLRLGNNEAPKPLGFFREICSLVAIKARVLRSLYMLQGNGTFPDSTIVLQAEEDLVRPLAHRPLL